MEQVLNPNDVDIRRWCNDDNADFYNHIPITTFQQYAVNIGLDDFEDLELIYPLIHKSNSLLEIGAGFGRVLSYLNYKKYTGKIYAIERSRTLYTHLKQTFPKIKNVIHSDIRSVTFPIQFDLALWMWSGIAEFQKDMQAKLIRKILSFLQPTGRLVIDTSAANSQSNNATQHAGQFQEIHTEFATIRGYMPSEIELLNIIKNVLEHTTVNSYQYTTCKGAARTLTIISKTISP